MSEEKTRSFTIRFTSEDQAALAQLCALYGLDRPASLRQAMRQVLAQQTSMDMSGYFIPVGMTDQSPFPVRLNRKRANAS